MSYIIDNLFIIIFFIIVISVLLLDLLVIGKNKHIISLKESLIWTSIWIAISLAFYLFILFLGHKIHKIATPDELNKYLSLYNPHLNIKGLNLADSLALYRKSLATDYITGYFLEYSLSIDNVFVILLILTGFSVSTLNYKTVLFWGILGAIILRFTFIFAGSALIIKYNWILLIFGAFLLYSGIKMFLERKSEEFIEVKDHWLVKFLSKHFNIYPEFVTHHFWKKIGAKFYFTPLLVVLILIEFTDLVFAFDSIPAIFSITRDPYIVFFSNIFAIIGLRSLFFLLIKVIDYFHYLKVGISFLLAFVGLKLLFHEYLENIGFKNIYSLYFILFTLTVSILASIVFPEKIKKAGIQ
jgi:tellurite resistance protein TerC